MKWFNLLCDALHLLAQAGLEAWRGIGDVVAGSKHRCCIVVAVTEVDGELGQQLMCHLSEGSLYMLEGWRRLMAKLSAPGASTLLTALIGEDRARLVVGDLRG